ncbi:MAG TPA: LexA family transcriptional regulator [Chryseosolibacter sp.]|nr:LexA family transcriptional regulator [Chryseosolibacter sp.]
MELVNQNLRFIRTKESLTQREFAERLGLKQATVGAYEEGRATPPIACLMDVSRIFKVSLDNLISTDLAKLPEKMWRASGKPRKEVLAITVDIHNKENVELVTQKASAGYLAGYQDPEFVKDLPKISMPVLPKNRTYRAFEIQGDSMLPVQPGSIIFAEYVEDVVSLRNGKLYILVTRNDGIVFKRVFNFAGEEKKMLLVSDNRLYEPYGIDVSDILEVWAAKAFFSSHFPDAETPGSSPMLDQLALQVLQLQKSRLRKSP